MAGATEEQRRQAEANGDLMDMVASISARQFLHFPGVLVSTDDLTEILEATR
jgi:beta-glucosidase